MRNIPLLDSDIPGIYKKITIKKNIINICEKQKEISYSPTIIY